MSPAVGAPNSRAEDQLYFGVSDTDQGRRAWLVRLGGTGERTLFMPPAGLRLTMADINASGEISFRSEPGVGDVVYSYRGLPGPDGIRGVLLIDRGGSEVRRPPDSLALTLHPVVPPASDTPRFNGLFSNASYSAESGDLTGTEVLFVPDGRGLIGLYVSHAEGAIPYAANQLTVSGDTARFSISADTWKQSYKATLSGTSLRLEEVGEDSVEPEVLPRLKDVADVLGRRTPPK